MIGIALKYVGAVITTASPSSSRSRQTSSSACFAPLVTRMSSALTAAPSLAMYWAIHARSSGRPIRGAYWSVSARYVASAVAASALRSGSTPGNAWPESKAMFPGGAAAGSIGDSSDARRAKAWADDDIECSGGRKRICTDNIARRYVTGHWGPGQACAAIEQQAPSVFLDTMA